MSNASDAREEHRIVRKLLADVNTAGAELQKLYHTKHFDQYVLEALERLEVLRVGADANLSRYERFES